MSDARGPRRRGRSWIAVVVTVAVLAPIGFLVSIPIVNDVAAQRVESRLLALPLPEGAELVDSLSRAGKVVGNGNGMQYLGALLVRSDAPLEAVQSFYDIQNDEQGTGVTVIPTTGTAIAEFHVGGFFASGRPGLFVVYDWGEGPGTVYETLDLRGH